MSQSTVINKRTTLHLLQPQQNLSAQWTVKCPAVTLIKMDHIASGELNWEQDCKISKFQHFQFRQNDINQV